jgi:hypothetical protein
MRRGRREKELSLAGGPAAAFAGALREARRMAGSPTYRQMGVAVHFSAPALSQAASGARLPSWPVTVAYLKACGVTDLAPWENDWHIARIQLRLTRAKSAAIAEASTVDTPATPRGQLLDMLNRLAQAKGLSLRAIAAQTRIRQAELAAAGGPSHTLSSSTIHDVLAGRSPITHDFVTIFLDAVGATVEEQRSVGEAIGRIEFKRATSDVTPPVRAVGRAKVIVTAPAEDTFVLPAVREPSRPAVRCHRTAAGYYAGHGTRLENPATVVGMTVGGGVACWVVALAIAGLQSVPWSAYDFGSAVLIVSGFTTLVTVMVLLSTVLRDDDLPRSPASPPAARIQAWHRRWRYRGRHQGLGLCP